MAYGTLARVGSETFNVGDVGFVTSCSGDRVEYTMLSRKPGRTNGSSQRRLRGWLGTTNNVSEDAHGLGRVVGVDYDRNLVRYVPVADSKVAAALEALGHADLAN